MPVTQQKLIREMDSDQLKEAYKAVNANLRHIDGLPFMDEEYAVLQEQKALIEQNYRQQTGRSINE